MNRRGQTMALAIMSAIGVFIIGLMFVNFIMPEVTNFRTDMNCENATAISDGAKLLCLAGDSVVPYFILLVFSIGIGAITARLAL